MYERQRERGVSIEKECIEEVEKILERGEAETVIERQRRRRNLRMMKNEKKK